MSPKAELPRGSRTREAPAEALGSLGGGGALRKKKRVPIEVEAREEEDRCYVANVRRLSDEICCPGCKRKDTLTPGESERVFGGWGMVISQECSHCQRSIRINLGSKLVSSSMEATRVDANADQEGKVEAPEPKVRRLSVQSLSATLGCLLSGKMYASYSLQHRLRGTTLFKKSLNYLRTIISPAALVPSPPPPARQQAFQYQT